MQNEINKDLLVNVYGYDNVKKELSLIKEWLQDESILSNPKLMLPKGIIFQGRPGNGKTLLLREYAKSFNAPTFVIEGKTDNPCMEISEVFENARKEKFAIVMIDEIDLLISKDNRVTRALQQGLDGVVARGSVLVLATTNFIRDLPDALTRPGRFDRIIKIGDPDAKSRARIFTEFLKDIDVDITPIDIGHIASVSTHCSGADIRAVCNDAYLRTKGAVTTRELESSYKRICMDTYEDASSEFKNMNVAIHECGHVLMALQFKENWKFFDANFSNDGGYAEIHECDERVDTIKKREQDIMIGMGGYIAEEVINKKHDVGSYSDFQRVQGMATRLIERVCIEGISDLIIPYCDNTNRYESSKKRLRNEKKVSRLIKKLERRTRRIITKNKKSIIALANLMYEQGSLSYSDVQNIA
ncbi:MAG: AAA family ATPase [Bacilli bacterium]|nr:AAA family ATPase [Bacilli bacterium]